MSPNGKKPVVIEYEVQSPGFANGVNMEEFITYNLDKKGGRYRNTHVNWPESAAVDFKLFDKNTNTKLDSSEMRRMLTAIQEHLPEEYQKIEKAGRVTLTDMYDIIAGALRKPEMASIEEERLLNLKEQMKSAGLKDCTKLDKEIKALHAISQKHPITYDHIRDAKMSDATTVPTQGSGKAPAQPYQLGPNGTR